MVDVSMIKDYVASEKQSNLDKNALNPQPAKGRRKGR
jgi:hypothetical protein